MSAAEVRAAVAASKMLRRAKIERARKRHRTAYEHLHGNGKVRAARFAFEEAIEQLARAPA